jgi:hypothetical protein
MLVEHQQVNIVYTISVARVVPRHHGGERVFTFDK